MGNPRLINSTQDTIDVATFLNAHNYYSEGTWDALATCTLTDPNNLTPSCIWGMNQAETNIGANFNFFGKIYKHLFILFLIFNIN